MKYQKGQSGNPLGRPVNSKNKVPPDFRKQVMFFVESIFPQIQKSFDHLDDKDKIAYYIRLLDFCLPKMKETETNISFDTMSDEQMKRLLSELVHQNETNLMKYEKTG